MGASSSSGAPCGSAKATVGAEGASAKKVVKPGDPLYKFTSIKDSYASLDEVAEALHAAGLESSNLVRCVG